MTDPPSTHASDGTELLPPREGGSVPRRFGRYQIEEVVGKGAMGWVVMARDLTLQRPVALKLFHVDGDEEHQRKVKKRYVDEARAAAGLVHPHILQIYEVGLFEGWVFIAMEVLLGGDLKSQVVARGPMGWHEACTLIIQAADGLAYAHQSGMIHRDVKPANLMRTERGDCKVVDFGLTTRVDAPIGEPGAGTPNYQSPESARGHNGPQNDVWGLGASLWYFLTAQPPFPLDTPKDVLKIHQGLDLPDLRTLRPDVPEPVVRVIEQALAKHPGERFHLAEDFARVLKLAVEHATRGVSGPTPQAFARPVNPDLVELASAAGEVEPTGSSVSRSRSHSQHRQPGRSGSATPPWVYIVIAILLSLALAGTALVIIEGGTTAPSSTEADSGRADEPGAEPGNSGSPDFQSPGPMDDVGETTPPIQPEPDDPGAVTDGPETLPETVAREGDEITESFGAGRGLSETIGSVTVSASSAAEGNPPGYAIDGDPETAWQSDSKGWGHNTLTLDLNDAVLLEAVNVLWGNPLPRQVVIHISLDGEQWRTFSRLQEVTEREDDHRLPFAEEARYIRIQTRGESSGAPDIRIREVELDYE